MHDVRYVGAYSQKHVFPIRCCMPGVYHSTELNIVASLKAMLRHYPFNQLKRSFLLEAAFQVVEKIATVLCCFSNTDGVTYVPTYGKYL